MKAHPAGFHDFGKLEGDRDFATLVADPALRGTEVARHPESRRDDERGRTAGEAARLRAIRVAAPMRYFEFWRASAWALGLSCDRAGLTSSTAVLDGLASRAYAPHVAGDLSEKPPWTAPSATRPFRTARATA